MEPYARVTKLQDLGLQHMQAMVDQSALTVAGRLRLSSVGCPIEEWVDTCRNVRFFLLSVQQRNCEVALLVFFAYQILFVYSCLLSRSYLRFTLRVSSSMLFVSVLKLQEGSLLLQGLE